MRWSCAIGLTRCKPIPRQQQAGGRVVQQGDYKFPSRGNEASNHKHQITTKLIKEKNLKTKRERPWQLFDFVLRIWSLFAI